MKKNKNGAFLCFTFLGRYKWAYWILVAATLISDYTAQMGLALLNRDVINSVTAMRTESFKNLIFFAVLIVVLYIIKSVLSYAKMYTVRRIMYDLRIRLFTHMESLSVGYFEKNHSGDSIFRLNSNVENMKRAYTMFSNNIIGGFGGGIISCVFILALDIRLGLVSLCSCALTVLVNLRFSPVLRHLGRNIQIAEAELVSRLSDMLSGLRVIKLYRNSETATGRCIAQNEKAAAARLKRIDKAAVSESVNRTMEFINNFVLITVGAVMSAKGISDFGTVFAILSIQGNVSGSLMNFGVSWGMMQESAAAAEMIQEVFDQKSESSPRQSAAGEQDSTAVEFRNVVFAYDEDTVLNGVSLKAERGKTAALAGTSGGGKSTVIKLIPRFYDIRSGEILVDGVDIKEYTLGALREKIAYVPQEAYLFDETIMENIRFGKPDASDEEVYEAAKMANAHEFITELPHGYGTYAGERGEALSGGQRQRIAIARAFLKNAPILLLDEATSALDNETELLVQQSLDKLMKGRTTLVVAHRLSTIRNADVIYVMRGGRVEESGTHNELAAGGGLYSELTSLSEREE